MRRSSRAILLVFFLFAVLVALNFLFFVDSRGANENEQNGNRSSFLSSPYGTLAYYMLLQEEHLPVSRYTHSYKDLRAHKDIGTLVIIAPPLGNNPSKEELEQLDDWVENGGLAIIIDRQIFLDFGSNTKILTLPSDGGTRTRPLQPALYTEGVQRVEVTEYASRVNLNSPGAVAYIGDAQGAILADAKVGKGRVVCLTDPFIVANNGISKEDNLEVALNILRERPAGQIAFDEFHHGYGSDSLLGGGGMIGYFRGTPVPWMMGEVALLALLVIYNYGRRFGRPVPLKQDKRTTNLEFVSSMATITRLARATGLAMQNIYWEFHRRLCRYSGLPPNASAPRLAATVSRRSGIPEEELMGVLVRCGQIANGAPASDNEMLTLVSRIREIEADLRL